MDSSYPAPAIVGKAFVKQYYTQMHRDPTQLHRFYLEQSSFVHGGADIGSEDPVIGQKCIHDKIKSLDLSQVHAKIKQVDSHATLGNGIVVQVTGELSTGGRPMRAFVQTFVLAPESPKKYYVHNDIFRYQDDDLSESETNELPGDGENPGGLIDPTDDGVDYSAPSSLPVVNADGGKVGGTGVEPEGGLFPSQGSGAAEQGLQNEVHEVGGVSDGWEHSYEDSTHLRSNGLPVDQDLEQSTPTAEDFALEPSGHVTNSVGEQGGGDVGTLGSERFSPHDQDLHKDDSKMLSWAGRLASKQAQSTSQNRPLNSMTVSGSQALPQRDPPRQRRAPHQVPPAAPPTTAPSANHTPNPAKESAKKTPVALNTRDAPDSWQIFVGGLPHQVSESDIHEVFSGYDSIAEVRVNPKNFAFVVFNGPEPVEKIISSKERFQLRGKTLNIEPKRPSAGRGAGGFPRNKQFGGGGMGGGKPRGGTGGAGGGGGAGSGKGPVKR